MIAQVKYPVAIIMVFVWIGFVCAISFMEAWLKFRAPGVTLPVGLGIGRLVFSVLNKVEWVFAVAILLHFILDKNRILNWELTLIAIPVLVLALQTIWILPALDVRAEMQIQGQQVASSNLHFYYVGMEVIKVVSLSTFGIKLFN
jgi:hypothetical protein